MKVGARVPEDFESAVAAGGGQDVAQPRQEVQRKVRRQRAGFVGGFGLYSPAS